MNHRNIRMHYITHNRRIQPEAMYGVQKEANSTDQHQLKSDLDDLS